MSWIKIKALNEQRDEKLTELRAMIATAENRDDKDFTADESKRFDARSKAAESLKGQHARASQVYFHGNELDEDRRPGGFAGRPGIEAINRSEFVKGFEDNAKVDPSTSFGLETRMADVARDSRFNWLENRSLSIGKLITGLATGDWSNAPDEQRAQMSIGTGSAGGVLVPTPLSNNLIDFARNNAKVFAAGARTQKMTANTLKQARVTADPAIGWREEAAAFATGQPTLEAITFTARSLGTIVSASVELIEDVEGLSETIYNLLGSAFALELDRVCLRGTGTAPEPKGIKGSTGVQTMTAVGDIESYLAFSQAVQKVREANGEPNAILIAPRTAGDLDRASATDGQPLLLPPSLRNLPFHATKQIPVNLGVGTNESEFYVGDFTKLLVGLRSAILLEVSRAGSNGTDDAFSNGLVHIRAMMRCDVQLATPAHFVYGSGLTSPA